MTRRLLIPALATLVLAMLGAGCGRSNQASVEIGALCYPTDDCTFSSTCDKVLMTGTLWVDLQATPVLVFPLQINNQRLDNADIASGRVNTNNAVIDRFEMTYQVSGSAIPAAISAQTIVVPAAGSTVAGVTLIPTGAASAVLAGLPAGTSVSVQLKAHGSYQDGTEFDTGEHPIPVTLQNGLFTGYACTDTTQTVKSVCPNAGQTANVVCE
jgi:hypothetical protein